MFRTFFIACLFTVVFVAGANAQCVGPGGVPFNCAGAAPIGDNDLILMGQSRKTVAGTAAQMKNYVFNSNGNAPNIIPIGLTNTVGDQTTSLNALLAVLPSGSNLILPYGYSVTINGVLTIPPGRTLGCPRVQGSMTTGNLSSDYVVPVGCTLLLGPSGQVVVQGGGGGLIGVTVLPFGMSFPQISPATFQPTTAVTLTGDDAVVEFSTIIGFDTCISGTGVQRKTIDHNNMDCQIGIISVTDLDSRPITDVRVWPWATVGASSVTTTLNGGINNSVTSITLTNGASFPIPTGAEQYYVDIDAGTTSAETVQVTAIAGNVLTVLRGRFGTTAVSHSNGAAATLNSNLRTGAAFDVGPTVPGLNIHDNFVFGHTQGVIIENGSEDIVVHDLLLDSMGSYGVTVNGSTIDLHITMHTIKCYGVETCVNINAGNTIYPIEVSDIVAVNPRQAAVAVLNGRVNVENVKASAYQMPGGWVMPRGLWALGGSTYASDISAIGVNNQVTSAIVVNSGASVTLAGNTVAQNLSLTGSAILVQSGGVLTDGSNLISDATAASRFQTVSNQTLPTIATVTNVLSLPPSTTLGDIALNVTTSTTVNAALAGWTYRKLTLYADGGGSGFTIAQNATSPNGFRMGNSQSRFLPPGHFVRFEYDGTNWIELSGSDLSGTTAAIGGGALGAGACASGTVAIVGSTTGQAVAVSPASDPQADATHGVAISAWVSSAGTVTVRVCALIATTPNAVAYNVRVIQ